MLSPMAELVALDHQQLDICDADAVVQAVRAVRPDVMINTAAYTSVDLAESETSTAYAANGQAPGVLAEEAKPLGSLLVHFSTAYVFDGSKSEPYTEEDMPNPRNVYGRSKLQGACCTAKRLPITHLVV
jgi:dTDP-4-dehydrorhamnose reductase